MKVMGVMEKDQRKETRNKKIIPFVQGKGAAVIRENKKRAVERTGRVLGFYITMRGKYKHEKSHVFSIDVPEQKSGNRAYSTRCTGRNSGKLSDGVSLWAECGERGREHRRSR